MILELVLGLLGIAAQGVVGQGAYNLVRQIGQGVLPKHNAHLQKAVAEAFRRAGSDLAKRLVVHEDDRRIVALLAEDAKRLFVDRPTDESQAVVRLLVIGNETELREALWTLVAPLLLGTSDHFHTELKRALPGALLSRFSEVLKDKRHQEAWIAFERDLLWEIRSAMSEQAHSGGRQIRTLSNRLEAFEQAPTLLAGLAGSLERVLAAMESDRATIDRIAGEEAAKLDRIWRTLEEMRRLVNGGFLRDGEQIPISRRYHDDEIRRELESRSFVGRSEPIARLDKLVEHGGYILVTAPAGGGKSSLVAHWLREIEQHSRVRTCYHFFSELEGTDDVRVGMTCLAEQLLHTHRIEGTVGERDASDVVAQALRMDDPARIVVVLDGLDEARDSLRLDRFAFTRHWFPKRLGTGVSVIFTFRTIEGRQTAAELRDRLALERLETLPLPELGEHAVRDIVRQAANPDLAARADDPEFVRTISVKTGGLAIYVRHLIDGFGMEKDPAKWDAAVDRLPSKFGTFAAQAMQAANVKPAWRDALRFIAVAKGRLSDAELRALTQRSDHPLQPEDFAPWAVQRWLRQEETGGWVFQHPAIQEAYAEALQETRQPTLDHLIGYCREWQTNRSAYASRYFARHLLDAVSAGGGPEDAKALFDVARDEEFRRLQITVLPERPEVPVETVQLALRGAAVVGEAAAGEMAELLLMHPRRLIEVAVESPLDAARANRWSWAERMVGLLPDEYRVAWSLLLIWELSERRKDTARTQLRKLARSPLPRLNGIWSVCAMWSLAGLADIDRDVVASLNKTILDDRAVAGDTRPEARTAVAEAQAGAGAAARTAFASALAVERSIEERYRQREILAAFASAQAQVGAFAAALATAQEIQDKNDQAEALVRIAAAQAERKDVDAALATTKQIRVAYFKAQAEAGIAEAQSAAGNFSMALKIAWGIDRERKDWRAYALAAIAVAQAKAGDETAAHGTMSAALAVARETAPGYRTSKALAMTAAAQAELRDIPMALETVGKIEGTYRRAWALARIATSQARLGDRDGARVHIAEAQSIAGEIENDSLRQAQALAAIAAAFAEAGDLAATHATFNKALSTAQAIDDRSQQAKALAAIGSAQAEAGLSDQAVATALAIRTDQAKYLSSIAYPLIKRGDEESISHFLTLLVPASATLASAYEMCGLVARLYPNQAIAVERAILSRADGPGWPADGGQSQAHPGECLS